MKKPVVFLMIIIGFSASAQFRYAAWNLGIQTGKMNITNAFSKWEAVYPQYNSPFYTAKMTDSANASYNVLNGRFNIEVLKTNMWVKTGFSFPIARHHTEHDSTNYIGKHLEIDLQFGYGFKIKEVVGFQFGAKAGLINLTQTYNMNNQPAGGFKGIDYFNPPSAGYTLGDKYFGAMAAWQVGLLMSNVIAFSDKLALRTTYSHNNLSYKAHNIHGRNEQLDMGLYYADPEKHNIGFNLNFVKNWVRLDGFSLNNANASSSTDRIIFPKSKVHLTTIYIGINLPINFGD